MKLPFKSIRWRLQAWHGVLLLLVLLGFGLRSYYLARENRFSVIDRALKSQRLFVWATMPDIPQRAIIRNAILESSVSGTKDDDDSPERAAMRNAMRRAILERLQQDLQLSDDGLKVTTATNSLFANSGAGGVNLLTGIVKEAGFYYVLWQADGAVLLRSDNVPGSIPRPAPGKVLDVNARTRGDLREQFITVENGAQFLVGCSIATDLASLHRLALRLGLTGCVIMFLGLAGDWWLSSRAIRPIREISITAEKIASGKLAERINLTDTDSELGQLAGVLNASFDQVQSAFGQLQTTLDRQVQFTANASHELRTPASVVLAEANSALARERTPAEYREALESCRRAARRMRHLTDSMLTLAGLDSGEQPGERGMCNVSSVVTESLKLLPPLAEEHGVKIHSEVTSGPCPCDPGQFEQVVTNLVSNAIQYNRPGGEVWVKVISEGRTTVLSVTDTGLGIAAEDLPHIFERFYRADKSRSQSEGHVGLGLAITKAIVEAQGGAIQVVSEPGRGSSFTVSFKAPAIHTPLT